MKETTKKLFEERFGKLFDTGYAEEGDLQDCFNFIDQHFIEREVVREEIEKLKNNPKKDIDFCSSYEIALSDLKQSLNI